MSGIEILLYAFANPKMNMFNLIVMGSKSISIITFELSDFSISEEEKVADEKKKNEETQKKNKTISSDL